MAVTSTAMTSVARGEKGLIHSPVARPLDLSSANMFLIRLYSWNEEMERDREILEQLAEYGMEVAAALKAQIVAASDADCADRLSLAFTRVSRSIRQTLAFKAKLSEMKAKSVEKRHAKDREHAIETSRLRFKKQQVGP